MRENEMVDISIILVNYKNVGLTEKCIVSLLKSKTEASFEIIVVDNNSGDGSAEILRDKFPHIVIKDSGKRWIRIWKQCRCADGSRKIPAAFEQRY